jgi:RNA polymerase sigma factor (sigma-70 family)
MNIDREKELLKIQDPIRKYCQKLCKNETKAKDLLQEVNLKILTTPKFHNPEFGEFINWALIITKNSFINELRKKERRGETVFSDHVDPKTNKVDRLLLKGLNAEHTETNETLNELELLYYRELLSLRDEEALVFEKRRLGYSFKEIQQEHNINGSSARGYARRARIKLQERFEKSYDN